MAGASNYPRGVDTDVQLLRRIASGVIVPADHNNLVDALEAIEPTVGICDDGTAYGGVAFNRGLTDHVGLMTTKGPNGRYPWVPPLAGSWYGTDNLTPPGWTMDAGLAFSYGPPVGPVHITWPHDTNVRMLVAPLVSAARYDVVVRLKQMRCNDAGYMRIGFAPTPTDTYLSGLESQAGGHQQAYINGGTTGDSQGVGLMVNWYPWWYVWVTNEANVTTVRTSEDGLTWQLMWSGADTNVMAYFVMSLVNNASGGSAAPDLWLDYVAFGNTAPQGQ